MNERWQVVGVLTVSKRNHIPACEVSVSWRKNTVNYSFRLGTVVDGKFKPSRFLPGGAAHDYIALLDRVTRVTGALKPKTTEDVTSALERNFVSTM